MMIVVSTVFATSLCLRGTGAMYQQTHSWLARRAPGARASVSHSPHALCGFETTTTQASSVLIDVENVRGKSGFRLGHDALRGALGDVGLVLGHEGGCAAHERAHGEASRCHQPRPGGVRSQAIGHLTGDVLGLGGL